MSLLDPTVAARESRAVALTSGDPQEQFGTDRRCRAAGCVSILSRYNPASTCGAHRGWTAPPTTRRRG